MAVTDFLSEYTCDNCGRKEITRRRYDAPNGWLELKKLVQPYGKAPEDEDYQFCSWECTRDYISEK